MRKVMVLLVVGIMLCSAPAFAFLNYYEGDTTIVEGSEGETPIDLYLGVEYALNEDVDLGARALVDVNNDLEDRYEAGVTFKFGNK